MKEGTLAIVRDRRGHQEPEMKRMQTEYSSEYCRTHREQWALCCIRETDLFSEALMHAQNSFTAVSSMLSSSVGQQEKIVSRSAQSIRNCSKNNNNRRAKR